MSRPICRISKTFKFEAAHKLPNHKGKCKDLHGHSYKVEVVVLDRVKPMNGDSDEGMVLDFGVLSNVWKGSCEPELDHKYLNDTLDVPNTTAEWIAWWIARRFHAALGNQLHSVTVFETATSSATIRAGEVFNGG